jgi:hypothetical protein
MGSRFEVSGCHHPRWFAMPNVWAWAMEMTKWILIFARDPGEDHSISIILLNFPLNQRKSVCVPGMRNFVCQFLGAFFCLLQHKPLESSCCLEEYSKLSIGIYT